MKSYAVAFAMALSLLLTACATPKLANSDALQSKALADAAAVEMSPEEMISRASQRLNNADQDLRFYSPLHIQQAQEQLENARKLQQSGKAENRTEALAAAILTEKLVQQAEDNREQVKQQLAPALSHRDILMELQAQELLPRDFNSAMSELKELIMRVESGQLDEVAKQQPTLLEEFARVEASTLKVKWLNRAKAKLNEAEDADAEKFAPKSYEQAELAIERADNYTDTNYRDRVGVKAKADEAFVLASKALNISMEVQKVFEKKISEIENYMLDVQSWLNHINQEAGVEDLEALTFYEQSRVILAGISTPIAKSPEINVAPQPVVVEALPLPEEPELSVKTMSNIDEADQTDINEPAQTTSPEAESEQSDG